jgi:Xaa-Pro dipeptidase
MSALYANRIHRLQTQMRAAGLDFVALVPGPNMLYFTCLHMHLSERPIVALLPADATRKAVLVTPMFEVGKAQSGPAGIDWDIHSYTDGQPFQEAFDAAARAARLDAAVIGVEPTQMRVIEWNLLAASASITQQPALDMIAALRMRKDAAEIDTMRKSVQLTERVLAQVLEEVSEGMTERQIGALLANRMMQGGADALAFPPLVQIGVGASNPHGTMSDRALKSGDCLLFDFGAQIGDYPADLTRTVFFGEPGPELRRIHETVKAANAAGRAAVKPGVTCEAVDAAARAVIEAAGYGQFFTHRTGHGLGLEIHEPPYLWAGNTLALEPGMTFTIEPGIYVPGLGGVRVEDDVLVTETGCESLTTFERGLIVLTR